MHQTIDNVFKQEVKRASDESYICIPLENFKGNKANPRVGKKEKSIIIIIRDIHQYLINETPLQSIQGIISMKGLFQGFIIKD